MWVWWNSTLRSRIVHANGTNWVATLNNCKHVYTSSGQHIHALQNSWHTHTTLHTVYHKHTTLSPHQRCVRTLHFMALVHWWPQKTPNSRCHQQLGPHNTKHKHTNQNVKYHTTTKSITRYRWQLNTHYHQTTYPSSPQLTHGMTTGYNKTDGLLPPTIKLTTHNSQKTRSPL